MKYIFFAVVDQSKNKLWKFLKHPITQHVLLLTKFALFNILLPFSDFVTDILTSQSYFQRGHSYWGICTILFVFLPFFGRFVVFIWSIAKCLFKRKSERFPNKITELKVICRGSPALLLHFPPLLIFR